MPARGNERIADLGADRPLPQRRRERAAGAPKTEAQRPRRSGLSLRNRRLGSRRRLPGSARFLHGGEDRHYMREPANRKDLAYNRVETSDGEPPFLRLRSRGGHQRPQPGARYVFDCREIDDDVVGTGSSGGQQPRLKLAAGEIVDASDRPQDQNVCLASLADLHRTLPTASRGDGIFGSLPGRRKNRAGTLTGLAAFGRSGPQNKATRLTRSLLQGGGLPTLLTSQWQRGFLYLAGSYDAGRD